MTRDLIIFKNIFLTVCVSLSGLSPSETHEKLSMRKMCDSSNEKQGEKLFLLWRHSALLVWPCSWLAKNRRQEKPCRRRYARDWSVRCTVRCTVRFAAPSSSHLHFESLLSLLGSLRKPLKTKFTPAVSLLSLSLSLSLSPRVSTLEKKNHVRSAQLIQAKVRKASVPSLFFLLWTLSTCGSWTARWMRTAPVSRL